MKKNWVILSRRVFNQNVERLFFCFHYPVWACRVLVSYWHCAWMKKGAKENENIMRFRVRESLKYEQRKKFLRSSIEVPQPFVFFNEVLFAKIAFFSSCSHQIKATHSEVLFSHYCSEGFLKNLSSSIWEKMENQESLKKAKKNIQWNRFLLSWKNILKNSL